MMKRLSIVVPFYGVERYIRQCLESLYRQDIPESEYEVICVNDCTPDHSEEIVLEFQQKHENLVLIRHEVNKKLGAARNTGLRSASGKYVWFVDSDDLVKENCFSEVLDRCEENNLQVFHWSIIDNHNKWINRFSDSDVTTGIDDLLTGSKDMTFPWNRVYNREFLVKNNLWFNDLWGGDVIHTIQALNVAERIMNSSECYYYYRIDNMTSDMRSPGTANKVISFCFILAKAIDETTPELSPRLAPLMDECVEWRINKSYKPILRLPMEEKRVFYRSMNDNNSLKAFVLDKANKKVRFLLCNPYMVYLIHPVYNFVKYLRNNCRKS